MRRLTAILPLSMLVIAACGSSAAPTPAAATPTPTATQVLETSSPTPTTHAPINAVVVFDGESCAYAGPAVIPSGTTLRLDYENRAKEQAGLFVARVDDGTTVQDLRDWAAVHPADQYPGSVYPGDMYELLPGATGPLSMAPSASASYVIGCGTAPTGTNRMYVASIIRFEKL